MENRELDDFNQELIEEVKEYASEHSENTESALQAFFYLILLILANQKLLMQK